MAGVDLSNYVGLNGNDYVPQPFYAHVDIWIGGILITAGGVEPPGQLAGQQMNFTLIDFEHVQEPSVAHSFTMKLFDKYWIDIETLMFFGNAAIEFQKYYTEAGGTQKISASPVYAGVISGWDPNLTPAGTLLTVECIAFIAKNRTEDAIAFGGSNLPLEALADISKGKGQAAGLGLLTTNTSIPDIVRLIADGKLSPNREKWKLDMPIEAKKMQSFDSLNDTNGDWQKIWGKHYRSDLQFLNFLSQYVEPVEGQAFRVWMTEKDGVKELHFRPMTLEDSLGVKRTFTWLYGFPDSEVIEFNPKMNVDLFTSSAAIQADARVLQFMNKTGQGVKVNAETVDQKAKIAPQKTIIQNVASYLPDSVAQTGNLILKQFSDLQLAKAASQQFWSMYSSRAYEASLTIVGHGGDHVLELFECVNIIVLTVPDVINNAQETDRLVHPSSGIYRIESITDSISAGVWTTNFNLLRTGPLALNESDLNSDRFQVMPLGGRTQITDLQLHGHGKDVPVAAGSGAPVVAQSGDKLPPPVACGQLGDGYNKDRSHGNVHKGVDIIVPVGTPIYAPDDVTVDSVVVIDTVYHSNPDGTRGPNSGGTTVTVTDSKGKKHTYMHLSDTNGIQPKDHIPAGAIIAYSGGAQGAPGSGNSTGPHVHYQIEVPGIGRDDPYIYVNQPQPCP